MARVLFNSTRTALVGAFLLGVSFIPNAIPRAAAQLPPGPPPPPVIEYEDPPEEDVSYAEQEYFFNPLQAKKEMDTGNFYARKGNQRAASLRYLEATRWDSFAPEPFYKLGEAYEKLENYEGAREAWTKFIELSDDKGKIRDIEKKFAEWAKSGD